MQCQTAGSYLFAPVIYVTNARSFRHPAHMLQFPLFFFLLTAKKSIESVKLRVPQKYHIIISDAN